MSRTLLIRLALLGAVCLAAFAVYRGLQPERVRPPFRLESVRGGLHVLYGPGGNVGILVTDEGVILIDNKFARDVPTILDYVRRLTDQPVRYILNTHHHGDHMGGNVAFPDSVTIVAHEKARIQVLEGFLPGATPIVFRREASIKLGGQEVHALYLGRGHTHGDVVIVFPDLGVIQTGDLYNNGSGPFVDYPGGGSARAWDDTLAGILALDFDLVIPGHGDVASRQDIEQWRADFKTYRSRLGELAREGLDAEAALEKLDVSDLTRWKMNGPQRGCIPGLLDELRPLH